MAPSAAVRRVRLWITWGNRGGLTVTYAELTIRRLLQHAAGCGIDPSHLVFTTDNGSEFSGNRLDHSTNGFVHTIESEFGAKHSFNHVGRPNENADVESVHNTIEREFYELETFDSLADFIAKATVYQTYYNLARRNYSKGGKSPLDLLLERVTSISARVFLLPPIVFGTPPKHRDQGPWVGHDVPALTEKQFHPLHRGGGECPRSVKEKRGSAGRNQIADCPGARHCGRRRKAGPTPPSPPSPNLIPNRSPPRPSGGSPAGLSRGSRAA